MTDRWIQPYFQGSDKCCEISAFLISFFVISVSSPEEK